MPQISQNIYILTHPLPERTSIKNPTHMTCMDNVVKVVFGWLTPCCLPESKTQLSTGRSISVLYIAEILQGAPRIAICGGGAMACLDLAHVAVTAPQLTAYLQTSVFSSLLFLLQWPPPPRVHAPSSLALPTPRGADGPRRQHGPDLPLRRLLAVLLRPRHRGRGSRLPGRVALRF
jgi:hypothetical protein